MDEIQTETQEQAQPPAKNPDLIAKAAAAAERLEKANQDFKKLLDRQEALKAQEMLGGQTFAGSKNLTAEDKEIQEARSFLGESGFDPFAGEGANAIRKKGM